LTVADWAYPSARRALLLIPAPDGNAALPTSSQLCFWKPGSRSV